MKTYHFLVSGKVQNVGYRKFTQKAATKLGIVGWVRNLSDGRVEAAAALDENMFNEFIALLKQGSFNASVDTILVKDNFSPITQTKFEILETA